VRYLRLLVGSARLAIVILLLGLALDAAAASAADPTYTWAGATALTVGGASDFGNASNWGPSGAPADNTSGYYVFPALNTTTCPISGALYTCYSAYDEYGGSGENVTMDGLTFTGTGYQIGGFIGDARGTAQAVDIGSGGITEVAGSSPLDNTLGLPLDSSVPQTWTLSGNGTIGSARLTVTGPLQGDTTTVDATNGGELDLEGGTAQIAPIVFDGNGAAKSLLVLGGNSNAVVSVSDASLQIEDDQRLGHITATNGSDVIIDGTSAFLNPGETLSATDSTVTFDIDGTSTPSAGLIPSELGPTLGGLTLSNATLALNWVGSANCPTIPDGIVGESLTLVDTDHATDMFSGTPNGSIMTMNCVSSGPSDPQPQFEINYSPLPPLATSDITATLMAPSSTAVSVPTTPQPLDQPVALTATVTQGKGTGLMEPDGTVEFDENGVMIPGCGAVTFGSGNGTTATATCETVFTQSDSGATIVAKYTPTAGRPALASSSPAQQLPTITTDDTTTSLAAYPSTGTSAEMLAYVYPDLGTSPPAGVTYVTASGKVVFKKDGVPLTCTGAGDGDLTSLGSAGVAYATCTTDMGYAGNYSITATYTGDSNFTASTSSVVPLTISGPAPGQPTAAISAPASGATYTVGQVVPTAFSCADPSGPGIASCKDSSGSASPGTINTSEPGTFTYSVTSTSIDGQSANASISYKVVAAATTPTTTTTTTSTTTTALAGFGTVTAGAITTSSSGALTVALVYGAGASGTVTLELTSKEHVTRGSGKHRKKVTLTVLVGKTTHALSAGTTSGLAKLTLNATGRRLLKQKHTLNATLRVIQTIGGATKTLFTRQVTFHSRKH
jgi:hypothetical protein